MKYRTLRAVKTALLHFQSQTVTALANGNHPYITQLKRLEKTFDKMLTEVEDKYTDEAWLTEVEKAEERLNFSLDQTI